MYDKNNIKMLCEINITKLATLLFIFAQFKLKWNKKKITQYFNGDKANKNNNHRERVEIKIKKNKKS